LRHFQTGVDPPEKNSQDQHADPTKHETYKHSIKQIQHIEFLPLLQGPDHAKEGKAQNANKPFETAVVFSVFVH
jgi:hypothetical protein